MRWPWNGSKKKRRATTSALIESRFCLKHKRLFSEIMSRCPRCNCVAAGQNRLVTDSCGHNKCRLCLLADEVDCSECQLTRELEPAADAVDQPVEDVDYKHITSTTQGYHCSVCNKSFRSRTQQYYHRSCGNEILKKFPCTLCSRVIWNERWSFNEIYV